MAKEEKEVKARIKVVYKDKHITIRSDIRNWILEFEDGMNWYYTDFTAFLKGLLEKKARMGAKNCESIQEFLGFMKETKSQMLLIGIAVDKKADVIKELLKDLEKENESLRKQLKKAGIKIEKPKTEEDLEGE